MGRPATTPERRRAKPFPSSQRTNSMTAGAAPMSHWVLVLQRTSRPKGAHNLVSASHCEFPELGPVVLFDLEVDDAWCLGQVRRQCFPRPFEVV